MAAGELVAESALAVQIGQVLESMCANATEVDSGCDRIRGQVRPRSICTQVIRYRSGKAGVTPTGKEEGDSMLKSERDTLLKVCRQHERVSKSEVSAIAARGKADFERQLAAVYAFDQSEVWKKAYATAKAAYRPANEEIAREAEAMGVRASSPLGSFRPIGLSAVRILYGSAASNSLGSPIAGSKKPKNKPISRSSGPRLARTSDVTPCGLPGIGRCARQRLRYGSISPLQARLAARTRWALTGAGPGRDPVEPWSCGCFLRPISPPSFWYGSWSSPWVPPILVRI